jgi:hypothetical protein
MWSLDEQQNNADISLSSNDLAFEDSFVFPPWMERKGLGNSQAAR